MEKQKNYNPVTVRLASIADLFLMLWKYKLWWSFPIILLLLILLVILLFAGHTGVGAIIYPLF